MCRQGPSHPEIKEFADVWVPCEYRFGAFGFVDVFGCRKLALLVTGLWVAMVPLFLSGGSAGFRVKAGLAAFILLMRKEIIRYTSFPTVPLVQVEALWTGVYALMRDHQN